MPKVWNIGNTTVRNPKRIEKALQVFFEEGFSGNAKGPDLEARIHSKLKEREVLEFDGAASDWNGRKWRAAFYQLGFISYEKYSIENSRLTVEEMFAKLGLQNIKRSYELTPAGIKLISATQVPQIEDIYLRQYANYELPNSLESSFPEGKMKPFILFVQVLLLLKEQNMDGLTKFETGLFLQKFRDHTNSLAAEIVNEIRQFRTEMHDASIPKNQKIVRNRYLKELGDFCEIDPNSVTRDYADTTFRYFSLSGLFTRIDDTIVIRVNKLRLAKALVAPEPIFLFNTDPFKYFRNFYSNNYPLPVDSKDFALGEITDLKAGIRDKANPLIAKVSSLSSTSSIEEITGVRYDLINYNNWEKEEDYANEQRNESSIKDILVYLRQINNEDGDETREIDDRPAFLEWAVWRSFLAINEIVNEAHACRRFQVDEDFFPRNTAPGGGADMVFEFEGYVLVVEVTLTTSHRQMAVESEPVRRHTVQYKDAFPDKDVYCLFIAPEVDNNVAETFRIGVWYKQDEEEFVNIVPMSLSDFIKTFEALLNRRFTNSDFRTLLDRCLSLRNVRAPYWKKNITKEVQSWNAKWSKTG